MSKNNIIDEDDSYCWLTSEQKNFIANSNTLDKQQKHILKEFFKETDLTVQQVKSLNIDLSVFNAGQLVQILLGLINSLSKQHIKKYAREIFDEQQMEQIRRGYENGLTDKQIKIYAKTKFNGMQMAQIRFGLLKNQTEEQIALYANPEYDWIKMCFIRKLIEIDGVNNVTMNIIKMVNNNNQLLDFIREKYDRFYDVFTRDFVVDNFDIFDNDYYSEIEDEIKKLADEYINRTKIKKVFKNLQTDNNNTKIDIKLFKF